MSASAIIVAAGKGLRAGTDRPKQYMPLGGKMMLEWSIETFRAAPEIEEIILVVAPEDLNSIENWEFTEDITVVAGGTTRTASVKKGLECVGAKADIVMIHDAARPGIDTTIVSRLASALMTQNAAVPALKVFDALKRVSPNNTLSTVDRSEYRRVQTPQAFRTKLLKRLMQTAPDDLVDDLAILEAENIPVALVEGSERYNKVTFAEDFARMEQLLVPQRPPRIGTGFDVHALEAGDHVTLCGVKIPHTHKLKGHSDADVAWHALTDAILGAAALGDLGDHFPPSDPQWKDADSGLFLAHSLKLVAEKGWQLANCDITIICEAPKVKPHRETMRKRTAELTGLPLDAISVKATTTEQLGFTGRKEGIAAQAVATLGPINGGTGDNVS